MNDPKSFEERRRVAKRCMEEIDLAIPVVVDTMDDATAKAYDGHPDRIFIVGADGKIAYRGDRGPRGFKVDELEEKLREVPE